MTVLATFSYGLIAFGPVGALFCTTVARHPHEVIIMMAGAFFWLLSLFCSSLVWIAVPPLREVPAFTLPFSVILQELFRWLYYLLLKRADKMLEIVSDDKTPLRKHKLAYVGGMGFGVIAGVVAFSNVLKESGGPGIVGVNGGSQFFVLTSAFATNVLILLHICWGVLWFDGWEQRGLRGWMQIFMTFFSHMLVAGLSLLNIAHSPVYFLVVSYIVFMFLSSYALYIVGAKPKNFKHFFLR